MKLIIILFLLIISIQPISYAKYNWSRNNKLGAVGTIFITLVGVVYPVVLLFSR
ncbi:MAG: hypothetical protein BWY74_01948 [Firmicutes bacterium ADurb.Bin419]|nr:MAG: hypothetical protein BWY74_01948 [Firmicutes bacterium ADurb.Bin419]